MLLLHGVMRRDCSESVLLVHLPSLAQHHRTTVDLIDSHEPHHMIANSPEELCLTTCRHGQGDTELRGTRNEACLPN
jgi:hypothetical protein